MDVFHDMDAGLAGVDIVMMLRLQRERMQHGLVPSAREYFRFYGLDAAKLALAKPDALVMHPGPMNRGVEIDSAVADDPRAQPDPRAGGDGRRRAHGGAGHAVARAGGMMRLIDTLFAGVRLIDPAAGLDLVRRSAGARRRASPISAPAWAAPDGAEP